MKNKLWLLQLPFILLCTYAFYVSELGVEGRIENATLRNTVLPMLKRVSTVFTDMKFHFRGERAPKNKIAVVEIDDASIEQIGRWPWHRDALGLLIDQTFKAGAKAVALDIVFSERDERVSDDLQKILVQNNLGNLKEQFETDFVLQKEIEAHPDNLVLGWSPDGHCQPLYEPNKEYCPLDAPELLKKLPEGLEKFAFDVQEPLKFDMMKTPLLSAPMILSNLPEYDKAAKYSGYFLSTPDPDGVVRRVPMVVMVNGRGYPSLPLVMAKVAMNESLELKLDDGLRVGGVRFGKSGRSVPVTPVGAVEVNFRGKGHTFQYVSALDVLAYDSNAKPEEGANRTLANAASPLDSLKDAFVFIGITAVGVNDIRAFPLIAHVPGVEAHANHPG